MYIQDSTSSKSRRNILIIVVLLLCSGTYLQYVTTNRAKLFSFEPVIPSLKKINDMSNITLPTPLENAMPPACQRADFRWLASDRSYWDGWVSKSFFMRKDGRFTRKNVQIGQDESVCVAVLLGPIPAVSSIKHMPHYAPSDTIIMTAKSESTGAAIPIRLLQHDKQSNVYYASVKFTQHGTWTLDTSVEYRSYFWEQPGIHHYRPNRFTSRNSLTVYKKPNEKTKVEDPLVGQSGEVCDLAEPFALKDSVWIQSKEEDTRELGHARFQGASSVFSPSCQFDFDQSCFQSKLTLHVWGDHHLKRNVQHLVGDRPSIDMCNLEQQQPSYSIDAPILKDLTQIHFGDIDTDIVNHHQRWKLDMQGISRRLPKADVVLLGVGNLDMMNMRQHPNEFAKVFMSFLDYTVHDVYPDQRIIVKTTQYFAGQARALNYGRSEAYANIIRSAIASLSEQDKQRVILWDTHQLGYQENACGGDSLLSHSHVVDIENAILSNLFI
ncbi:hypothetical protein MBANPS3_004655 [Mucor bainieri]